LVNMTSGVVSVVAGAILFSSLASDSDPPYHILGAENGGICFVLFSHV
jgi:hypothetical protein